MATLIINRFVEGKVPYKELLGDGEEELLLIIDESLKGFDDYDEKIPLKEMSDINIEYNALKLSKEYDIKAVIATHEFDLIPAARIREKLGIKGQKVRSAEAFRDKIIMKDYAGEVMKVPAAKRINSGFDIYDFVERFGFPCVLKPISGAGSERTFVIKNFKELDLIIKVNNLVDFEIEEFIDGSMYIVDGFILDGELNVAWASKYINGCLSFQEGKQTSFIQLVPENEISKKLIKATKLLIGGMPLPEVSPIHAEFIVTNKNDIYLCEIASRTGGGGIGELSELLIRRHITNEWVVGQSLKRLKGMKIVNSDLHAGVLIPPKIGRLIHVPMDKPFHWIKHYKVTATIGMEYQASWSSSFSIINVLISGNSEEELIERMDVFYRWVEDSCVWEENENELVIN
jgi:ATP-grasp domain